MPSNALTAISEDFTTASTFSWLKEVRPSRPFENFSRLSLRLRWLSAARLPKVAVASRAASVAASAAVFAVSFVAAAAVVLVVMHDSSVLLIGLCRLWQHQDREHAAVRQQTCCNAV